MKSKQCKHCGGPIERGPHANNKKFCSQKCRDEYYYEHGMDRVRWTKANAKEAARRAKYAPGKIQCLECKGWYKAPVMHVWQAHGLTEAEYKKKHGLDHKKGLLMEPIRENKSRKVFENRTVENLEKGKPTRFKKGQPGVGRYERSAQTKARLAKQFKVYGPHAGK